MEKQGEKPTMCSVLFMEIVEYSRQPVSAQIALKAGFTAILVNAIGDVPAGDRIVLDTGDGAVICFLGDADTALKVALLLREGLLSEAAHTDPPLRLRLGINYGPVRLVRNANDQPNIVGDGINVAQRVMGFAKPGQMLVSRSYYDAVSRLTQKYVGMFHHQGSRTDKHVREHELFAISLPGAFTITQPAPEMAYGATSKLGAVARIPWQLQMLFAVAVILLLFVALFKVANRPAEQKKTVQAPQAAEAPHVSQPVALEVVPPPKAVEPAAEKKLEAPQPPVAKQVARPTQEKHAVGAHTLRGSSSSTAETAKGGGSQQSPASAPGEIATTAYVPTASVRFAVTPWGEVYLDGKMIGVSPPLEKTLVTPGKHKIEIRNMTFPAYTQSIELKAGDKIKIRHTFR